MNTRVVKKYKVAGHIFSIETETDSFLWSNMEESYGPFEIRKDETEKKDGEKDAAPLFTIRTCDMVASDGGEQIYSDEGKVEDGFMSLNVSRTGNGFYFFMTQPGSKEANARLSIDSSFAEAELSLHGNRILQWLSFTAAVDFCFLLATACHNTLLTHSSAVIYKGRAYLFLGKSGTGKSTHSRMWLNAIEDVTLMNDDHPVIRVGEDGIPVAYGSPWSGKTRCYKNICAPVGGIVRISRAPHNKARRLSPIQSYASLMTSCSGMTWEKPLADGKDRALQAVVSKVPCWVMECLPDEDAAKVCCEAVAGIWEEKK